MNDGRNPDPSDERAEEPQLYALTHEAGGYRLKRRDLPEIAGAAISPDEKLLASEVMFITGIQTEDAWCGALHDPVSGADGYL